MSLVWSKSFCDKGPGIGPEIGTRTIPEIGPEVEMKVRPGKSPVMEPDHPCLRPEEKIT